MPNELRWGVECNSGASVANELKVIGAAEEPKVVSAAAQMNSEFWVVYNKRTNGPNDLRVEAAM